MTTPRGAHRAPFTRREMLLAAFAAVGLLSLLLAVFMWGTSLRSEAVATAPAITVTAPAAPVAAESSPAPAVNRWAKMRPEFAPPNGPGPDDSMYGVDVISLAEEFHTHGVDTSTDKLPILLAMTNRHIARGDNDLDAWDPPITTDTQDLYPDLSKGLTIDVTRCWAEYVERVVAGNAGLDAPPDSDDHNVPVQGRGPQPRVALPR